MVMDQVTRLAHTPDGQVITCGYCPSEVVFWPSIFNGHALCFDALGVDVRRDRDNTGWVPTRSHLAAGVAIVYTPRAKHTEAVRRRHRIVWQLHICGGMTKADAA